LISISDTLSRYAGNFARPTKYNIVLSPPESLQQYGKVFDVLGKGVSVPGIINTPIDFKIKGQNVKIPGRTQQTQEIQITFYVDEGLRIRNLFQDWIYALDLRNPVPLNSNSNAMKSNRERFGNLIVISQDFKEENQTSAYLFEGIFLFVVGALEYSGSDKDAVLELTVTFGYYRFITESDYSEDQEGFDDFLNSFGVIPTSSGQYLSSLSSLTGLDIGGVFNGLKNGITAFGNLSSFFKI